tara:strand:+ start:12108 stop:12674 length:567 start_codon:yes stop_codon:yes gene_type:complete
MRIILSILLLFFLVCCSKPKTAFICGDHVCINKSEAEQYFEENLTIEVKIIDNKVKDDVDLVELNLKDNPDGKKRINIFAKNNTNKNIKTLSKEEVSKIKKIIKNKNASKKIARKKSNTTNIQNKEKSNKKIKEIVKKKINLQEKDNFKKNELFDICTIIEKCSIDEISKYLLKQGKKKDFPDLTIRQ